MSLLTQASLVLTPTAEKAGKLYSVIPSDGSGDLTVVRGTTATRVNSLGLIENVAINEPRLNYETVGGCPAILIEPQRTNLNLQSEDITNTYWTLFQATRTSNVVISPSGVQNADKLIEDSTNNPHSIFINSAFAATIGFSYTRSLYAKADGRNWICLLIIDGTQFRAFFDLQNGIVGNITSGLTATITNFGNGWYRCSITRTASTTSLTSMAIELASSNGVNSYIGNGSSGAYIWGAQLETGNYATSYIPTLGSAQTRNADNINKTAVSALIGQTEGTIFAEVRISRLIGTISRYIFHISDGTANNRIYIAFSGASSNIIRARIFNAGNLETTIETSTITTTGRYKLALAYKNNDVVFYVNGVQIGTDVTASIPACSRVDLGQNYIAASQFADSIINANIFKTRLTNTELQNLTTL